MFDARPDVLNHNIETVARLQRAVRPSAGYARSLAVLARAKDAGLTTKSGIILGMGERTDEVLATLADLRAVGTDIVTLGPVPPSEPPPPAGGPVVDARRVRGHPGGRHGHGVLPRPGVPAHPLELSRQGGRRGDGRPGAASRRRVPDRTGPGRRPRRPRS